ncbi:uncharacterized protein LOC128998803 [Macrosteles quadrilineatus]|uniref:uncharacterized protein LOC128998803 n=1 Tax=Macrosteles quadrilineatus TaxID=74068 RepID=UPI0023E2F7CE|nr:uncharacterized protein LOC128998803 [Macrosteles quadrilineatus]
MSVDSESVSKRESNLPRERELSLQQQHTEPCREEASGTSNDFRQWQSSINLMCDEKMDIDLIKSEIELPLAKKGSKDFDIYCIPGIRPLDPDAALVKEGSKDLDVCCIPGIRLLVSPAAKKKKVNFQE